MITEEKFSAIRICAYFEFHHVYIFGNTHVQRGWDVISFLLILNLLLGIIWKGESHLRNMDITSNGKVQEKSFPRACNKNNLILDEYTERGGIISIFDHIVPKLGI